MSTLSERRIAVLLGGTSAEREISLQSGSTVVKALQASGAQVAAIDTAEPNWQQQLRDIECVFIALHGPGGEDGAIQGMLQTLRIPYTGSAVLGSALAMDKLRSKQLWQGAGVPTAGFAVLEDASDWQAVIERFGKVFVKPACEGSSLGMSSAASAASLQASYQLAAPYAGVVIAEQFIAGPEYTVAVLGDLALPSIRLETANDFYDFDAKYLSDDTLYHCPSGLSAAEELEVAELSLQAFRTLGCSIWGRADLMRDERTGEFFVLEVNTVPGMTSHSLVPMAAAAAGMNIEQLVERIVLLSLARDH